MLHNDLVLFQPGAGDLSIQTKLIARPASLAVASVPRERDGYKVRARRKPNSNSR